MPACASCGAFVGEDGKWAPAEHLSQVCTERDKAQRETGELRWAISSTTSQLRDLQDQHGRTLATAREASELLTQGLAMLRAPGTVVLEAEVKLENALKRLKELL